MPEGKKKGTTSSWSDRYWERYLAETTELGITPISRAEFNTMVGEEKSGGFEGSYTALIGQQKTDKKVADTQTAAIEKNKTDFTSGVDNAVTKGYLTADQADQIKGLWDSGLQDQAKANLTTWVNDFITKKNSPSTPTTPEDITAKTAAENKAKFLASVKTAGDNGYITADQATQLTNLYDINPDNATLNLNTWVNQTISKKNEPAVPKFEYKEPDYVTQAKKIIQEQMALDPTFNPDTVKEWFSTLQDASAPAKQADLQNNTDQMNSLGRMFSGQTITNSQGINNKYNSEALNKALGYAYDEYGNAISAKNAAIDKNLAIGQYETGISQFQNQQDVDQALRDLTTNLGTINTNNVNTTNSIQQALQRMYQTQDTSQGINWNTILGQNSSNSSDLNNLINRIYANEDWTKNADLTSWLSSLNKDQGFDWTKLLQPSATVAAAAIQGE